MREGNVYSLYHDTDPIQQKVLVQRIVASNVCKTYTYVKK